MREITQSPVIPIVDPGAALSALRRISDEWMQREFQDGAHRTETMERAGQKADDFAIEAEMDIARAIGVKATVQFDPDRGTVKQRVAADKPREQSILDRAIESAWQTYGGSQNTARRDAALYGRAAIDFSGTTVEYRHSRPVQGLDPDRLLHLDASAVTTLSPEASLGAEALYWALQFASVINSKASANANGFVQLPPRKHLPKSMRTDYERLKREFNEDELRAMEKERLGVVAEHARELRTLGLIPAVITESRRAQLISQIRAELSQPGTDERKKVSDRLKAVLDNAGVTLSMPPRPEPKRRSAKGRAKVPAEQTSFETVES